MAAGARKVTIGFEGGQMLALRLPEKQLSELEKALGRDGWHTLEAEDGPVKLDLAKVVYLSADSEEPRVGFG